MSTLREMRVFLLLRVTQAFSGLGSAATGYALVLWSFHAVFGSSKGSGAAMCFALEAVMGVAVCLIFMRSPALRAMQAEELKS